MQYCLVNEKETRRFSGAVDCTNEHPVLRYKARSSLGDFEIELQSHLKRTDSINGKDAQTPDEIIKHRDFVIGKLKAAPGTRFGHWKLRDFKEGTINLDSPGADFVLKPLLPPKKVFIAGFPEHLDFVIAHGFLNLSEDNGRGYFAADLGLYRREYLIKEGIPPETRWGIGVANHMSGGPRTPTTKSYQAVTLSPTNIPLYLREDAPILRTGVFSPRAVISAQAPLP
jgi:hypothetical protein